MYGAISPLFKYQAAIENCQTIFECTPSRVYDVYSVLEKDPHVAPHLQLIETQYFQDGVIW